MIRHLTDMRFEDVGIAGKEVPVAGCESILFSQVEAGERTVTFRFEKPAQFDFAPGHAADGKVADPPRKSPEGKPRILSIAGSALEDQLMFVNRMCDTAFKRSPKNVPLDTEMNIGQWVPSRTQEFSKSDDVPGRLDRSRSFSQNCAASRSRRVLAQVALPTGARKKAVGSTEIELFRGEQYAGKQA